MIINKFQLRDYPCLYYLSSRLPLSDQCKFICGLGSIFSLNSSEISASSILFAHTSNGILYDGVGFEEDEVSSIGASVFEKPFTDCKTLCKWGLVKKMEIKQECCVMCPLSTTYLNARIESEKTCLRYTIKTGKVVAMEPNCYQSVIPIAAGNDLSEYPLIPFYNILNDYFISCDPHGPYDQDELCDKFGSYLCERLSYKDNKWVDAVYSCVKRELNILFNNDLSQLSHTEVNVCHLELLSPYRYETPKVLRPDKGIDLSTEVSIGAEERGQNDKVSIEVQLDKKNFDIAEIFDSVKKKFNAAINGDIDIFSINNDEVDLLSEMSQTKEIRENELTLIEDKLCSSAGEDSSDIKIETLYADNLFFPNYKVPDAFAAFIGNCATDNAKVIVSFMTDICSSLYTSIESVVMNDRPGLLFMTYASGNFYFFDLDYASSGYLYPALSDATKLKFLSINPLPVISMLTKLGFESVRVESITGLYCLANNITSVFDYGDMFNDTLSVSNDFPLDFYQFYMHHYKPLYIHLIRKLEEIDEKAGIDEYNRGVLLDEVLGANYDLSDVIYQLNTAVNGRGFCNYQFMYNKDMSIIKPGVVYYINLPSFKDIPPEHSKYFFEEVAISVHRTPSTYIRYAKLLSIVDAGIIYYSSLEGDMFLDVLLDVVRRTYKKVYKAKPEIKTYRIEYQ